MVAKLSEVGFLYGAAEQPAVVPLSPGCPPVNILVVDDSSTGRLKIKETLSAVGFEVLEAENVTTALSVIGKHDIAMVFSAVDLPGPSGIALLDKLNELATTSPDLQKPPIVMLTHNTDKGMRHLAKNSGAMAWVAKPFDPPAIVALANRLTSEFHMAVGRASFTLPPL